MRSNSVSKVAKPPPPIPPRPSKTLVAEALAKTRSTNRSIEDNTNCSAPLPFNNGFLPVTKSQSYSTINNKSAPQIQRSTSNANEKKATNCRPIVFQSSNVKTSKIEVKLNRRDVKNYANSNNVLINLNHKNQCISRNDSFKSDNEKNHVNALIDEMFASILDIPDGDDANIELPSPEAFNKNVNIPIKHNTDSPIENKIVHVSNSPDNIKMSSESLKDCESTTSNETENDDIKRIKFNDKQNHEFLISELQSMHKENKKKKRPPPLDFSEDKILRSDWVEVDNGREVRLSRCEIIIDDCDIDKDEDVTRDDIVSRLNMSSSYGLPPLPKSLSGFSLNPSTPSRITPPNSGFSPGGHAVYPPHPRLNGSTSESPGRNTTNLDNQLAILRREMYSLRQLDLSLLSQLWSLNESIQDFRQMLQEQDDRGLSPPSPSPSPSSCDDGETDEFFSPSPMKLRPAPPPPPLRRTSNSSSANSSEYGTV